MNRTITLVSQFATDLDAAWARGGRRVEALPELARDALAAARLHEQIDPMEAVSFVFRADALPPQYDPLATFGEPPVTLWRNEHLFIDMYFWVEPDIALHDHAFAGAFTNLVGHSLHCEYSYAEDSRPSRGVSVGALEVARVEALGPGSTSTIRGGAAFIHRVWHLSRPTVTLVARTPRLPGTHQARYFLPSLALNDPVRDPAHGDHFRRQQQFMRYLIEVGHPDTHVLCRDLILGVSPVEAFSHLEAYVHGTQRNADDWERCDGLVTELAAKHGDWARSFGTALHGAAALRAVRWDRLVGFPERLLIAILQTYSTREAVVEASERFRTELQGLVSGTVREWLESAITGGGLTLKLADEQLVVAMMLADGASEDAIVEQFAEEYELGEAECAALVELARKLRGQPLLGKLLS